MIIQVNMRANIWVKNRRRYVSFIAGAFLLTASSTLHYTTIVLQLFWNLSGTTRVSWYQKGKTNLDLLEQEIVSGICGAICKSDLTPDR